MLRHVVIVLARTRFQSDTRMSRNITASILNSTGIRLTTLTRSPHSKSTTNCVPSISLLPTHIPLENLASKLPRPRMTWAAIRYQSCAPSSAILPMYSRPNNSLKDELRCSRSWNLVTIHPRTLTKNGKSHSHAPLGQSFALRELHLCVTRRQVAIRAFGACWRASHESLHPEIISHLVGNSHHPSAELLLCGTSDPAPSACTSFFSSLRNVP